MKVLIVVDMQNDFIDGSLGSSMAEGIVENVRRKIEFYKKNGDIVIFTRDTHGKNYLQTQEGKNLPVEHCINGTFGWQISEKLPSENCKIIDKPSFGSFELCEYLSVSSGIEQIELVGLCTDICVISNAMILKAKFLETPIVVDSSCCAGVTQESHINALNSMKMCQIQVI